MKRNILGAEEIKSLAECSPETGVHITATDFFFLHSPAPLTCYTRAPTAKGGCQLTLDFFLDQSSCPKEKPTPQS